MRRSPVAGRRSPGRAMLIATMAAGIATSADAQLLATRNIIIAPALDTAPDGKLQLFPQPRFFIEVDRGWGSESGEQAWNIKLGGSVQIELGDRRTVLLGVFGHELTSNPYNDIGYNPRGALWDENAFVVRRHASGAASYLGVLFRCRHELDNADGHDERLPDSLRVPTARVVGLGGLQLGHTGAERPVGGWKLRYYGRAEWYFHQKDDRSPFIASAPDWRDALGAGALGARVSRPIRAGLALYARAWGTVMVFTPEDGMTSRANARAEIGVRGWNMPAGLDLHLAYERWFDDLSRPVVQPNRAFIAGVRVSGAEFF